MVRRALDTSSLFPLLFGQPQALLLSDGAEVPEHKWIHVASTGTYRGHWQGEFDLTRAVFDSFVKNLRRHPQFKLGSVDLGGGKTIEAGCKPTIQFDYEHCSEMPATEGTIPRLGAEAPAWVMDLEVRPGDGADQLWALAWLGAQIRDQIKRNAYRQTSIAFDLESKDWVTGEPAGPALTSIAFTNHPFLKQLESYAAANRRSRNSQTPGADAEPAPPARTEPMTVTAPDAKQAHETFKANVCRRLGIRVLADDAAVEEAVGEAAGKGSVLSKLLTALGVNDADAGLKVIPEFRSAREQLSAALTELDEMLQGQATMDAAIETQDISAVMSAMKYPDDEAHKEMIRAFRTKCMDGAVAEFSGAYRRRLGDDKARIPVPKVLESREDGRKKFFKTYGIVDGVDTSGLTKTLAASKGGAQHTPPAAPPRLPISERGAGSSNGAPETVDLRAAPGVNPTDVVIRHLSSKDASFAKLPHYEKCKQASQFSEQHNVLTRFTAQAS